MMDNLRTAANSPVLKIVLGVIMVSFVLTGVGGYLISGSANDAAEVNGQPISRAQLQQAFQQERQTMQERLGDRFSEVASNEQTMNQLRRQALENLINVSLFNQYANKLGLSASDAQIKQSIFEMPIFQVDGQFNSDRYRAVLAQYNINADNLAQQIGQDLVREQLGNTFSGTEFALPSEVKAYAELIMQKRDIRSATLSLADMQKKQTVTEQELQDYYHSNQSSFLSPEKVKVSYIKLDAANMSSDVKITDEEIKTYYEQNLKNFTQPQQQQYSMIQVATPEEAAEIESALKQGADFATLASEKSTDKFSAANKGVIGWMEATSTPSEIIDANLTEKGQFSAPIKSTAGYIIFRLDDIKPEVIKPLDQVKSQIETTLRQDSEIKQFYDLQQKVSDAATNDNESLISAEEAAGIKKVTTDWFDRNNPPQELNFNKVIAEIFSDRLVDANGTTGLNSDVINVEGDRAFVIRVDEYKPEAVQPFDSVKQEITDLVKRQKAEVALQAESTKLLAALKDGKGEAALTEAGVHFDASKTVTRLEQQNPIVNTAFSMPEPQEDKPTFASARDSLGNVVIIQLDKVIAGQPEDQDLQGFAQQYKALMSAAMQETLMINLRDNAKVEVLNLE
ncbi:peptidylprolyl isomerase [Moellerella wisconsensis]|uniref:peptidylprolyl isomerase n=1 Tax=Moellerella wisconsensis TaxID=158849 RepID=UPI000640E299|nr:peptidylprolyl isomerase [Moellerella wisconsensis]KLN96448.1 molecular chaperone [Moellerella wisconsensis]